MLIMTPTVLPVTDVNLKGFQAETSLNKKTICLFNLDGKQQDIYQI